MVLSMGTPRSALVRAARAVARKPDGRGFAELAALLGVSRQAVYKWLETRVPIERCPVVERVTGVSRYELRPDIYGAAPLSGKKRQYAEKEAA